MAQSRKPSKLTYKQVTRPRVRFNPGSKRHLQAREHEEKALELRKAGYSYKEIGAQLGISRVAAFQSVMRVLAAYEDDIKEQVPRVRQLELQRLDSMLTKLQPRINQGDDRAINSALKIGERRAKLMGLDAPLEIDHSGTIEVKMTDEQLDAEIRQLASMLGMIAAPAAEPEPTGKTDPQKIESARRCLSCNGAVG